MGPRWNLEDEIQPPGRALSDKTVLRETSDGQPGPQARLGSKSHD